MDDDYGLIADTVQDTISTLAMAVDELADPIQRAAASMVATLLQEGKVMACGNGVDAGLSQLLCSSLLAGLERDRPSLPAMALSADGASVTGIAHEHGLDEIWACQVRALGQPGDTLVCFSSATAAGSLLRAIEAARERNVAVVVLSNAQDASLSQLLEGTDIAVACTATRRPRVIELHTVIIHLLCELIDRSLFGNYNGN
ncbi:SIS domain-containing protein [Haliea sp.]|jgi:phosphoheptose isomerase|uniref:D-sedoheptulose-7-phosphate isomerase n=1 Tax=Haliea TaxID=475794 RepID=UPI000C4496D2|nr:SIS domain-containing protein [Haliea sp.]HAN69489.1 phosphoheptose isomerase [Halieaceae bacterium]MAY93790.1 phosphoheptose isomerase [Haliea sp.]MBK41549.1 phosphoheptose isomerase [Haliea sp.]MBP70812.1 phosphoheptose isomerase [Haliea sp.]HCD54601.1 phosphoheptose isomerase [Halieaceae bacterium]|tara:strand:- start:4153 stop:4755 length:603 start_codon:yes stop_codon:yes gene_type:complete